MVQSLLSPLVMSTSSSLCLSFACRKVSPAPDSVKLQVILVSEDNFSKNLTIDWPPTIDWVYKKLTFAPPSTAYQLKFVTEFSQQNESVELKDVQLLNESCPLTTTTETPPVSTMSLITCYFSENMCGFLNSNKTSVGFDWHTDQSKGLSVKSDFGEKSELASVISQELPYLGVVCLNLNISTTPSMQVQVNTKDTEGYVMPLLNVNTQGDKIQLSVTFLANFSRIQIEANNPRCPGQIHITYLDIKPGPCEAETDWRIYNTSSVCPTTPSTSSTTTQTTTTAPTTTLSTTPEPVLASQANCDFETSTCGYLIEPTNSSFVSWERKAYAENSTILAHNGTSNTVLQALVSTDGTSTSLTSPKLIGGSRCLVFYYYVLGQVTLQVSIHLDKKPTQELWSYTGSENASWALAQIALQPSLPPNSKNYKIIFTAVKPEPGMKRAVLVIDDIEFLLTDCADADNNTHTSMTTMFSNVTETYDSNTAKDTSTVTHVLSSMLYSPTSRPPLKRCTFRTQHSSTADKTTRRILHSSILSSITSLHDVSTIAGRLDKTTVSNSLKSSTVSSHPRSNNIGKQKIIAIVVPTVIIAILIIVVLAVVVAFRFKRRSSVNIGGELYDAPIERKSNSTSVYVNHAFTNY
ncbi:uncharacterized protein [Watersipora subatra]|uniref:uncharacterized protein n=1 Tax=Watersipora subatra TaxID=2589382 RepID=UPI00355B715E